jgi:hypothetical protein
MVASIPVLQDVMTQTQSAKVGTLTQQRIQGLALLGVEFAVAFKRCLQLGGHGIQSLRGLVMGKHCVDGMLA